jgi:hypothetical protein
MQSVRRSSWLVAGAIGLATFCIAAATLETREGMGQTFEFGEYADIAREITRGNGFTSHVLYPSVLAFGDSTGTRAEPGGTYPVMNRHPGFSLALAPFIATFGDSDRAVHFGLAFFFAAWTLLVFLVIDRRLGRIPAFATTMLVALNPVFLQFLLPGGFADILFAALVLVFLDRCASADDPVAAPPWRWFLLGLVGSAAWMVRFNFSLLLYIGAASLLMPRPDRKRIAAALALLLGFWLGCIPFESWHTWTFGSTQSPPTLWNLLDGFPGYESPWKQYRVFGMADVIDSGLWWNLLTQKYPYFLFQAAKGLPTILLYLVPFPFFVAALFRRDRSAANTRFLALAAFGFLAMMLVLCLFRFESFRAPGGHEFGYRYYIWFMPVLIAFAVDEATRLLAPCSRVVRALVLMLLAVAQLAFFASYWTPLQQVYTTAGRFQDLPMAAALARLDTDRTIDKDLPIFTNVPTHVGWYLDRPALLMTTRPEEAEPLWNRHPVSGVLFTRLDIGEPALYPLWTSLFTDADATKAFLARTGMKVAFADDSGLLLVKSRRADRSAPTNQD